MCGGGWGPEALGQPGLQLRGGGSIGPLARPPPPPKRGSIDGTPKLLPRLTPGLGGDPDPKIGKKRMWDFGNQRVEGVQKSHHLPYIW